MTDTPIALVTGASQGIGRAAAVALARAGHHVVAVARAQGRLEALDDEIRAQGGTATIVPLDLGDMGGIDRLGGALHERYGRLDVLVHAAARLGDLTPVFHMSPGDAEKMIAVNLTATWRLMRSMEPLLKAAPAGRALIFSSGAARRPRANWGLYAATKAAVEALAVSWAQEIAFKGVGVAVLNPGPVATAMRKRAFPGENQTELPKPEALASCILELVSAAAPPRDGSLVNFRDTAHFRAWMDARG